MGTEIERRFLMDAKLFLEEQQRSNFRRTPITQGYLSFKPAIRARLKGEGAELTVKGEGTLVRPEFNFPISIVDAKDLLNMCLGTLIRKDRFAVGSWEVDRFHGSLKGLWVAEIELATPDEAFARPVWIRQEITEDTRFSNSSLARNGIVGLEGYLQDA